MVVEILLGAFLVGQAVKLVAKDNGVHDKVKKWSEDANRKFQESGKK